jgi:hypothetical protein
MFNVKSSCLKTIFILAIHSFFVVIQTFIHVWETFSKGDNEQTERVAEPII